MLCILLCICFECLVKLGNLVGFWFGWKYSDIYIYIHMENCASMKEKVARNLFIYFFFEEIRGEEA